MDQVGHPFTVWEMEFMIDIVTSTFEQIQGSQN